MRARCSCGSSRSRASSRSRRARTRGSSRSGSAASSRRPSATPRERGAGMARKRKPASHENHERWLVSYADFITLLFAFFVVMFATSQTDKAKATQVSDAVTQALENGGIRAMVHEVLGGTVDEKGQGNAMMRGPGGAQPVKPPE